MTASTKLGQGRGESAELRNEGRGEVNCAVRRQGWEGRAVATEAVTSEMVD